MSKQHQRDKKKSENPGDRATTDLSNRLLNALTQQEIAQLIDALFEVLSPELQEHAIAQLSPDTQQTVKQILSPPAAVEQTQTSTTPTISLAKQAQTWSELWQDWNGIMEDASNEEGKYIVQEADWEPPYFDTTTFAEDLERVADKMLPLLQTAFEQGFTPDDGFIPALLEAESEISNGLADGMELTDGLYIEQQLTHCVLQWEWLTVQSKIQDAFYFAQHIRQYEQQFREIEFDDDTVLDFLTQLPEADQRSILTGLTADKETSLWKRELSDTHSHWHSLYLYLIEQYAPDRYLENLRETIPQQWQNGLPIIEALLTEQNYAESLVVIEETLKALLNSKRENATWTPETSLLAAISGFYYEGEQGNANMLLRYYQQTAEGLNQTERANALEIQQIAIAQWFNWSTMFQAFAEIPVSESTRQALFTSWRDYVDRKSKPHTWHGYGTVKTVDNWWVPWLINSVADSQKGANWFQQQITQWIANLPGDKIRASENYHLLRLLTNDLTEIQNKGKSSYPQFYQVVIRPTEFFTPYDQSRREYLKKYAPADLLDQVMNYWKVNLHHVVPKPESAHKSDYSEHAHWMVALKELSPQSYETLLAQWRADHQRRSNLWKAMKQMGLD
jgi:hypothetical protein